MRKTIVFITSLLTALTGASMYFNYDFIVPFIAFFIFNLIAWYDFLQLKHSLKRNFPIFANLRWFFEGQRDKIRQYFNESDLDGTPYNKEQRSVAFQRSKLEQDTVPFGTQLDVYKDGYEFVSHSMYPKKAVETRVLVGGKDCTKPYDMSIINISAMSYGAISQRATMALNKGAKKGNFAQNTGEGGISEYHLMGGDLVFQVGTGYFGAGINDENGVRQFSDDVYAVNARRESVKMVELKLSQGAKPGHGGILPAIKNTPEIANIRGVEPYTTVNSPSAHTAFSNNKELAHFIKRLRQLSGGKPVGIKFCVTNKQEIESMISTFCEEDIYPDFITIDGAEGGTGSAPLEYSNHVGYPLIDGLIMVKNVIKNYSDKYLPLSSVKIISSGKAITSFDVVKLMALGSDAVNMSRAFMFSLGCIQARECNKDTCPVGITTNNPKYTGGLVVAEKYLRVYNFHNETIKQVVDMVGSMGLTSFSELKPNMILKRKNDGIHAYG